MSIPHHELKANEGDNEEPEENKEMHDSFSFVFRETTSPCSGEILVELRGDSVLISFDGSHEHENTKEENGDRHLGSPPDIVQECHQGRKPV